MERKETPAPYCHGEHMVPMYIYKENGVEYRVWKCFKCMNTSTLEAYVKSGEEK